MKRLLAALLLCTAYPAAAQTRPNVLWITIEDTSPQFIGCYGNKAASTPNIDKLAAAGVKFTNAFSTNTVCSPSRTALITGVKTSVSGLGNHRSNYAVPAFLHGFPHYLKSAGYHTSNNAKTDYNVADPKAFIADAWNESSGKAGWWNRKPGQPFFSVFNFNDSHQSRTMTDSFPLYKKEVLDELPEADRIADNAFEMPPFYRDSPEMRKQLARVYNAIKLTDNKIGQLLDRLQKDNLRDSTIIFFFADHGEGIPRGKTNGINLGYRVPFVIWFPPMYAHLSPWGAGVVTDELVDFEDLAPTVISLCGGKIPAHMQGRKLLGPERSPKTDHLVLSSDRSDNGIDMVRTVTDGQFVYARNFMPYMPEVRYIRYMEIGEIKQQMRKDLAANKLNALQKQLFEPRPAEFLFDIQNDPWETKNLATDPKFGARLASMRKQLQDEIRTTRDVMLLPEYEIAALPAGTNAFEYRLSNTNFPMEEIADAALLSGMRGADVAKKQIALLKNENKIVRYWAALGLRAQPGNVLKPFEKQMVASLQDTYPPAAILLAATAFEVLKNKDGKAVLIKYCNSENPELALMTVNELLYVKDKKPFTEAVRSAYRNAEQIVDTNKARNYKVKAGCMDFMGILGIVANNPQFSE